MSLLVPGSGQLAAAHVSIRQKIGIMVVTASIFAGLGLLAWRTTDLLGTIVVIGVASIFFLRQLERSG
jgi:hypothetical protein